jgi:two-component system, OmpR family, response regulator
MPRVLLVDDDPGLRELLSRYLEGEGLSVLGVVDGTSALKAIQREDFDAVVLDIMLPDLDGLEILRRIRARSRVPVLMLTAKGDETDRVVGLEIGADDYISKPFSPRELLARVRAVLRRTTSSDPSERLVDGALVVDVGTRVVTLEGEEILLTGYEFDLLVLLLRRRGRVVSRETLQRESGRDEVGDRAVDVHVSHLRKKLRDESGARIKTVRGVGYVYAKSREDS